MTLIRRIRVGLLFKSVIWSQTARCNVSETPREGAKCRQKEEGAEEPNETRAFAPFYFLFRLDPVEQVRLP